MRTPPFSSVALDRVWKVLLMKIQTPISIPFLAYKKKNKLSEI